MSLILRHDCVSLLSGPEMKLRSNFEFSSALVRVQNTFVDIAKNLINYCPTFMEKNNKKISKARVVDIADDMESFNFLPAKGK